MKNQNKPVIEDVKTDKLDEPNSMLKSGKWGKHKNHLIRKYVGGMCTVCAETPTKKVFYDLEGYGQRVEWYCGRCFTI